MHPPEIKDETVESQKQNVPYPDYLWFGKGRGRGSEFSIYFVQDSLYKIFVGILSFTVWTHDDCAFTGLILQCL